MKPTNLPVILAIGLVLAGCFRVATGRGVIYYEAKTTDAVQALRSRIEPLRTSLRNDPRFTEKIGADTLEFSGTPNGEFEGCRIGFNRDERDASKDFRAVLVIGCSHSIGFSKQAGELRKLVEQSLGPEVIKLLEINSDEGLMDVK